MKADDPVRAQAWFPDGRRLTVAGERQAEVWTVNIFAVTVKPAGD